MFLLDDALPRIALNHSGIPLVCPKAGLMRQPVDLLPGAGTGLLAVVLDCQGVRTGKLKFAFKRHFKGVAQHQPCVRRHAHGCFYRMCRSG